MSDSVHRSGAENVEGRGRGSAVESKAHARPSGPTSAASMRTLTLLLVLALLPACRVGYVLKQYQGQRKIQREMRPIAEVLADSSVSEEVKRKLRWVLRTREFGIQTVGLSETDNYTWYYDTGGKPVAWKVTACRKHAFKERRWWFPIVGSVPYLGFFDKEDAIAEQRQLAKDGWDTHLSEVAAYNTLGWFVDPVFSPMLRSDDGALAATVLHEMTHGTVYLPGQSDFDETLAEWVGNQAARELLASAYGPDSAQARAFEEDLEDEERFHAFLHEVRRELEALYAREIAREEKIALRAEVFARAKERFAATLPLYHSRGYASFLKMDLNNALILSYGRYRARTDLFDRVFEAHGRDLRATVRYFQSLGDSDDARREMEEWLARRSSGPLDGGAGGR